MLNNQPSTVYVVQLVRDNQWVTVERTGNELVARQIARNTRVRYDTQAVRVSVYQTERGIRVGAYTLPE